MLDQPTAFFCLVFNSVAFTNTKIEVVSETQFIVKIPKREVLLERE